MSPWSAARDHLRLTVRLTTKAAFDKIEGPISLSDGTAVLAARVRAVPESGMANAAIEKLISKALGVPRSNVHLAAGHKSRIKQLKIAGDVDALMDLADSLWPD
ncbi:MAG: DUF167 family protein [Alphaproteobacteria bacterium]